MAIVSVGYEGQILEGQWARLARHLGAEYAVLGPTDFAVTTVVGLDRTVRVAAGSAVGHGVMDTSDAAVNVQLPVIASGTRWDLICFRRDWQPGPVPGGTSTIMSVQGAALQALPAGRQVNVGVVDDQPLALVQVTAGQTLPTVIIDLRVFASKVLTASNLLALPAAPLGTEAQLGEIRYRRELDASLNLAWSPMPVLRSQIIVAPVQSDHPDTQQRAVTAFITRNCPTGRVALDVHANGFTSVAGSTGNIIVEVDGVDTASYNQNHQVAGVAGRASYAGTKHVDVVPGSHTFRLVARRWAGTGLFTIYADAQLTVTDVRK